MARDWRPTATLDTLRERAKLLQTIRDFFTERQVLEVDTPLIDHYTVTDPFIHSFTTQFKAPAANTGKTLYLQTSPEFAMKRLLTAGSGAIYQLGKVYRNGEAGQQHSPEFTMVEWYRPELNYFKLMDEVAELLERTGIQKRFNKISYQQLFEYYLGINPHIDSIDSLRQLAQAHGLAYLYPIEEQYRGYWLDYLLTHCIEPLLPDHGLFIYDFPTCHAALAQLKQTSEGTVSQRFELYLNGIELANGFQELTDSDALQHRMQHDQHQRQQLQYDIPEPDIRLLRAMEHGLPECSGVSLGVDRLLMLLTGAEHIEQVMPFAI